MRKLPKGWSVKTITEEAHLVEMYRWVIFHNEKEVERSFIKLVERDEAREAGVKRLWQIQDKL